MAETRDKKRKGASEASPAAKKTKIATQSAEAPKLKSALKRTASRTIVKGAPGEASVAESKKPQAKKPQTKTKKAVDGTTETVVETVTEIAPGKNKKTKTTKVVIPVETVTEVAPEKAKKTRTSKAAAPVEATAEVAPTKEKKTKTTKTPAPTTAPVKIASAPAKKTEKKETSKSAKATKAAKKDAATVETAVAPADEPEDENAEDDTIDDQTAALLAGFESSEDENDPEDEEGLSLDKIPSIPNDKQLERQIKEAAADQDNESTPGVVYVGRIPHGFYEHQMRSYFTQFGTITHLRLARNKLTGRPKHYAFVEFASAAVADIVAKAMDKYLMFNHILQVRRVPAEQVHANLWKGEGKRFKAVPRNKIEGGLLRRGVSREAWERRIKSEEKSRNKKAKKLAGMGYEFEMPKIKGVDQVPVQEVEGIAIVVDGEEIKVIEDKAPEEQVEEPAAVEKTPVEEKPVEAVVAETSAVKRKTGAKESKKVKNTKT